MCEGKQVQPFRRNYTVKECGKSAFISFNYFIFYTVIKKKKKKKV